MSYITPVILENNLKNPFYVGVILSISSFIGIFFDLYVSEKFGNKSYKFFIFWTILIAGLFPLSFMLLPRMTFFFILSMVIWSVYYELRGYSKFNFVHAVADVKNHTKAFSITNTFQWIAYMIGPLIAVYLLNKSESTAFTVCLVFISIAAWLYLVFAKISNKKAQNSVKLHGSKPIKVELRLLKLLTRTTAPILAFTVAVVLLDVTFWSTGILFAEELRNKQELGYLFMTVYGAPALFVGLIAPKFVGKYGKKKIAFLLGILAGLSLGLVGIADNIILILLAAFISSAVSGIVIILTDAVLEDYVARLKSSANELISINQIAINLAYAIGPIILGFISKEISYNATFVFSGMVLIIISLLALLITPRKIKMPQKSIATLIKEH
jgi:MFS family permease